MTVTNGNARRLCFTRNCSLDLCQRKLTP